VAIAALLLWVCTAAVGSYLLVTTTTQSGNNAPAPAESAPVPAPARPVRDRDRFDPPSLQRAKSEPLPGMKALAEFSHPALAIIGLAFWVGYVINRDRVLAATGLGLLLGAICAGLSWFIANTRAARSAAAGPADDSGTEDPGTSQLPYSPRIITLHAVGAALTLLFAALIAAHA